MNTNQEQNLKPIKDYENIYSLDLNNNSVYSHIKKKYLKPTISKFGLYQVSLYKNKKEAKKQLHRLIYEAHNNIIEDKYFVKHKDGNKLNNSIDNLYLSTVNRTPTDSKINKNNNLNQKHITLTKSKTYRVRIQKFKKCIYSKTFKTLEEAITNRDIQLTGLATT